MPDTDVAKPIPDCSRLTRADLALILKLADDGQTQTFIAQQIGCSQPTVSEVLRDFSDTAPLAKRKAHNLAYRAVQKLDQAMDVAAEKGRSAPQEAILKLAGLLEQDQSKAGVTVIVGGQDATVQVTLGPIQPVAMQTDIQPDTQVIDV